MLKHSIFWKKSNILKNKSVDFHQEQLENIVNKIINFLPILYQFSLKIATFTTKWLYLCILTMPNDVKNASFCHILFGISISLLFIMRSENLEMNYKNVHPAINFPSIQLFYAYGLVSWPVFFDKIAESQNSTLTLSCLISTKRSHILKQTCSFQLQVCLSMCDLLVDIRH